jgi:hypothetical protein
MINNRTLFFVKQTGGNETSVGNEITIRYFAKYYVKVLIDFMDAHKPNLQHINQSHAKKLMNKAQLTTELVSKSGIMSQITKQFPVISIVSTKKLIDHGFVHYFYHIKNSIIMRHYYRDPPINNFKPIIYIKKTVDGDIVQLGFIDVPQFNRINGYQSSNQSSTNKFKNGDILLEKTKIADTLKKRTHTEKRCDVDGHNNKFEIDCIINGNTWN